MTAPTAADYARAKRFVYDYNVRDCFGSREAPIEELADALAELRAEMQAKLDAERKLADALASALTDLRYNDEGSTCWCPLERECENPQACENGRDALAAHAAARKDG